MADSAPVMVWVADPRQQCTYVNRPWLAFTGRALKEALGSGWQKPIHAEDRAGVAAALDAAFAERREFEIDFRLRRHDGEYRYVTTKGSPMRGPDGLFLGYVGSFVDITERRNAEEATRVRERDFQRLDQFLALVSHELRSPLNGIIGWAHVLENELADGTPAMKRALAGIKIGVEQEVRLIEDLLDARVMSGNRRSRR